MPGGGEKRLSFRAIARNRVPGQERTAYPIPRLRLGMTGYFCAFAVSSQALSRRRRIRCTSRRLPDPSRYALRMTVTLAPGLYFITHSQDDMVISGFLPG